MENDLNQQLIKVVVLYKTNLPQIGEKK